MLNLNDILETINMIKQENLDIRTITMGISLFDCISDDQKRLEQKIYDKIYEMCWRKIKYVICDTKAYNLDIEVEDENENIQITDDDLCKNADKIME